MAFHICYFDSEIISILKMSLLESLWRELQTYPFTVSISYGKIFGKPFMPLNI